MFGLSVYVATLVTTKLDLVICYFCHSIVMTKTVLNVVINNLNNLKERFVISNGTNIRLFV